MRTSVPPGFAALIDEMVGTHYGETRAEVIRYILISWTTANIDTIGKIVDMRRDHDRARAERVVSETEP